MLTGASASGEAIEKESIMPYRMLCQNRLAERHNRGTVTRLFDAIQKEVL